MDTEHVSSGRDDEDEVDPTTFPDDQDTTNAEAALAARLSRKRTKTGCLTCRRRRIKCGEERPICKNCIKSKRICEGYSQRVVFKQPAFDHQSMSNGQNQHSFQVGSGSGQPISFHGMPAPGAESMRYGSLQPRPDEHFPPGFDPRAQNITPERPMPYHPGMQTGPFPSQGNMSSNHANAPLAYGQLGMPYHPIHLIAHPQMLSRQHDPVLRPPFPASQHDVLQDGYQSMVPQDHGYARPPAYPPIGYPGRPPHAIDAQTMHSAPYGGHQQPGPYIGSGVAQTEGYPTMQRSHGQATPVSSTHSSQEILQSLSPVSHQQQPLPHPEHWPQFAYRTGTEHQAEYQDPRLIGPSSQTHQTTAVAQSDYQQYVPYREQELLLAPSMNRPSMSTPTTAETRDEDACDTTSDEEAGDNDHYGRADRHDSQVALGRVLGIHGLGSHDEQRRRYDTFIYAGFMDQYVVKQVANVIKDDSTKRVFAHFIAVTGPSLSIFQRHHCNTSSIFNENTPPPSQQGLWTYSLPEAALRNQGLMHAMLALASLHMARLQDATTTPSLQHYEWAIKSIHHDVGHPKRRLRPTTVAASLLLGLYEVWTADHFKWSMHLAGSSQLFVDINFSQIMRSFRQRRQEYVSQYHANPEDRAELQPGIEILDGILNIEERVVSGLVGREVRYGEQSAFTTTQSTSASPIRSNVSLADFEILRDLYWWYCKQDVYYSIVSGNPLLMKFDRWADCPPRAALGDINAVYGSFDHLLLLLGRIANFASKDRDRKLKQMKANGGPGRPGYRPGAQQSPVSSQQTQQQPLTPVSAIGDQQADGTNSSRATPSDTPPNHPPMFFGMAPAFQGAAQMPPSYMPVNGTPTVRNAPSPCASPKSYDLEAATRKARQEYDDIRAALAQFRTSLGDAFQPLSSDYHPSKHCAFGPITIYRRMDIGCLWAFYHMAEIIAIRSRPDMPPYMHVAAGMAATETRLHAEEIGRISAGLCADITGDDDNSGATPPPLNPTLGAALCESCMPSFFAAIQFRAPAERAETVRRIYSIARRTGWGSGELIANGCETAWVKADEATGRTPPYVRILRPGQSNDPRLTGSWEKLNLDASPDEEDEADRRLVKKQPKARLFWGIGVMGREGDL